MGLISQQKQIASVVTESPHNSNNTHTQKNHHTKHSMAASPEQSGVEMPVEVIGKLRKAFLYAFPRAQSVSCLFHDLGMTCLCPVGFHG